jgi:hypothetical protein
LLVKGTESGDAVDGLQVRGSPGHHRETPAREDGSEWKRVLDVSGDPVTRDVFIVRVRIKNLHELELRLVGAKKDVARVIHDLRKTEAGFSDWMDRAAPRAVGRHPPCRRWRMNTGEDGGGGSLVLWLVTAKPK